MGAAILLGALSAAFYGAADVLARLSGRRVGPLRTILYGHGAAALLLSGVMVLTGPPRAPGQVWLLALLSNSILLFATTRLYRAFQVGRLSVVAPIVAAYGGVSAVLAWISGESLRPFSVAALGLVVLGGVLTALPRDDDGRGASPSGLAPALLAALAYGVGFWLQGRYVAPSLGPVAPVWAYYVEGTLSAAALAWATGARPARPVGLDLVIVVSVTALACLGTLALTEGAVLGQVAVTTVLSGGCCAVTVLMARLFLNERISAAGWGGVVCTVLGVGLLRL